jgi:L-rhamnose isomerase / sugar isomerase
VLGAHALLLDAFRTDVRAELAAARARLGAAEDPVAEVRGYAERITAERGGVTA